MLKGIKEKLVQNTYVECPHEDCLQEITANHRMTPHKPTRDKVKDYLASQMGSNVQTKFPTALFKPNLKTNGVEASIPSLPTANNDSSSMDELYQLDINNNSEKLVDEEMTRSDTKSSNRSRSQSTSSRSRVSSVESRSSSRSSARSVNKSRSNSRESSGSNKKSNSRASTPSLKDEIKMDTDAKVKPVDDPTRSSPQNTPIIPDQAKSQQPANKPLHYPPPASNTYTVNQTQPPHVDAFYSTQGHHQNHLNTGHFQHQLHHSVQFQHHHQNRFLFEINFLFVSLLLSNNIYYLVHQRDLST